MPSAHTLPPAAEGMSFKARGPHSSAILKEMSKGEGRHMELRTLRYFLTIAREGNMTLASKTLYLTQPALSHQLKELERELGVQLFERRKNSMVLTESGRYLKECAEEILAMSDKIYSNLSKPEFAIAGDIHIGAGESHTARFVAKVASRLQETYPRIRYHLHNGNANELAERLDQGFLDFCILIQPADISKYCHLPVPDKDEFGIWVRKDNPLAKKEAVRREDILEEPLICSEQAIESSFTHNAFIDWFGGDFELLNIVGSYNLSYNATLFAAEGFGSVVALQKQIRVDEAEVLCFVPFEPRLEISSNIVWKKHRVFSPAAEAFLEELKKATE